MPDVGCAGMLVEDTFCGPVPALPPAGSLTALADLPTKAGGCAANVAIGLAKQAIAVQATSPFALQEQLLQPSVDLKLAPFS